MYQLIQKIFSLKNEIALSQYILPLLIVGICLIYFYFTRHFNYWKNRNVTYLKPTPFVGNLYDILMLKWSMGECFEKMYNKTTEPLLGFFSLDQPALLIRDTKLIQKILVNDFSNFDNRNVVCNKRDDPVGSQGLFFMKNPDWKALRTKISPIYTAAKLKSMSSLLEEASGQMIEYVDQAIKTSDTIDIRDITIRFVVNVISSTAYGDAVNSFEKDGMKYLIDASKMLDWDKFENGFRMRSYFTAPILVKLLRLKMFHPDGVKGIKTSFWNTIAKRTQVQSQRNDLINTLIQLRASGAVDGDLLAAQSLIFFVAGSETSNSAISFALYELAHHQEVQNKLRDEINEVSKKFDGINYDAIKEMTYLDMIVYETLRKYPSFPFLDRYCNSKYTIPGTNVEIDKGTPVFMSVLGLQHDPEFFPNPANFDPERFSAENKDSIDPFAYLAFGQGPRNCIGSRFGRYNVKFALAYLIKSYLISGTGKYIANLPLHPQALTVAPGGEIVLKFKKI